MKHIIIFVNEVFIYLQRRLHCISIEQTPSTDKASEMQLKATGEIK